jgi:hypothetical protein
VSDRIDGELEWQARNGQYLAAALRWLRLRLQRQVSPQRSPVILGPAPEAAPTSAPAEESGGRPVGRRSRRARQASEVAPEGGRVPVGMLPPGPPWDTAPASDEDEAAKEMEVAASSMDPPPALVLLGQRLGLSRFEQEVLLLCAATELDTSLPALCADAQHDPSRAYPTFALALVLFGDATWDVLSPHRPLRSWRLIEISQHPAQPLTASALRADERILNYLKGLNYLDDRLEALVTPLDMPVDCATLPASQQAVADSILRRWAAVERGGTFPVILLLGPDTQSKRLVAIQAAANLGLRLYRLPADLLPATAVDLDNLARLLHRESALMPVAIYLDAQEAEGATGDAAAQMTALSRFLARSEGVFFLGVLEGGAQVGRSSFAVDVSRPTQAEQRAAWAEAFGDAGGVPQALASQFRLELTTIQEIARVARADGSDNTKLATRLWDACLASTRPRLDALAQRVDARATWDDIVLPAEELRQLHQIADQVRGRSTVYETWGFAETMSRGLGINALFAGASGTGKTMAAEVIANHLRLNLFRIDLSAVVSKYIGETEKNLRRLFDAAEDGGAILFFDEADALFGKRSEVKDSHDRYANIEVNYLLQRMESYRGLAILASNMKSALDPAFLRRLRFIVNFPFPTLAERRTIWEKVFPPRTPVAGLDYERLAALPATGGAIRNIALNAAFVAAHRGTAVVMPLVLDAARSEFRKLEQSVPEREFLWGEAEAS